jgi:hypothetical protein
MTPPTNNAVYCSELHIPCAHEWILIRTWQFATSQAVKSCMDAIIGENVIRQTVLGQYIESKQLHLIPKLKAYCRTTNIQ